MFTLASYVCQLQLSASADSMKQLAILFFSHFSLLNVNVSSYKLNTTVHGFPCSYFI